jgi:hypothetical protein
MHVKQLTSEEVRRAWLKRLGESQGKLPFIGAAIILPIIMIPLVVLTHGTVSSIIESLMVAALFCGYSLFVEVCWRLWRHSRGKTRGKIEKDLIPLAILHHCLVLFYFAFGFMWEIHGIAGLVGLPSARILTGGVLGFLVTWIYAFARGSYYNRLLFPQMFFDESVSPSPHSGNWQRIEKFIPMIMSLVIVAGSLLGTSGPLQYAVFVGLLGYAVANIMLFFSMLALYQLVVLLFVRAG